MFTKHSLCVAKKNGIINDHLNFISKKKNTKKRSNLLNLPNKATAGKKGGKCKNPWRPPRRDTSNMDPSNMDPPSRPFTDIHHNNEAFVVCFLTNEPKAKECRQCGVEFPWNRLIRPFDIVGKMGVYHKRIKCTPHFYEIDNKFLLCPGRGVMYASNI